MNNKIVDFIFDTYKEITFIIFPNNSKIKETLTNTLTMILLIVSFLIISDFIIKNTLIIFT